MDYSKFTSYTENCAYIEIAFFVYFDTMNVICMYVRMYVCAYVIHKFLFRHILFLHNNTKSSCGYLQKLNSFHSNRVSRTALPHTHTHTQRQHAGDIFRIYCVALQRIPRVSRAFRTLHRCTVCVASKLVRCWAEWLQL